MSAPWEDWGSKCVLSVWWIRKHHYGRFDSFIAAYESLDCVENQSQSGWVWELLEKIFMYIGAQKLKSSFKEMF